MKKRFDFVIEIVLILLIIISVIFIVLIPSKYAKKYSGYVPETQEYDCTIVNKNGDIEVTTMLVLKYDYTGEIISIKNYEIDKFLDKQSYKVNKERYDVDKNTLLFNDKDYSITIDMGYTTLVDEDNNNLSLWYKTYIEDLEDNGFICNLRK